MDANLVLAAGTLLIAVTASGVVIKYQASRIESLLAEVLRLNGVIERQNTEHRQAIDRLDGELEKLRTERDDERRARIQDSKTIALHEIQIARLTAQQESRDGRKMTLGGSNNGV